MSLHTSFPTFSTRTPSVYLLHSIPPEHPALRILPRFPPGQWVMESLRFAHGFRAASVPLWVTRPPSPLHWNLLAGVTFIHLCVTLRRTRHKQPPGTERL